MTSPATARDLFPIEIYEIIFKFLSNEKKHLSYLKACSLVSHDFLPLARNHIFDTIHLNAAVNRNPTKAFVQLISRTPIIAKYVRTLSFCVQVKNLSLKGLPRTLRKLTSLRSLTIFHWGRQPLEWDDIPSPLKDAFLYLFRLPTLSHLTLGPINSFMIPDLNYCSNLKYLSIRNVSFAPIDLSYRGMEGGLSSGRSAGGTVIIDFSHYQDMELCLDKDLQAKAMALFSLCSQLMDIQTYEIEYSPSLMLSFAAMLSPSLGTLQHLHFRYKVMREYNDPLCGLPTELAAIAGTNVIESISIDMTVETDHNCSTGDEWGALNRALTQPQSGWPNLRSVLLRIAVLSCRRKDGMLEKALRKLPESQLKGLARSKDFKLELKVQSYFKESNVDTDESCEG